MPKVSVIMPVYNGELYIKASIASVLAQEGTDLELIVVNDGSTDRTLEIVEGFVRVDRRVRVITRPNSGRPSFPKNDGIEVAQGEYICFLDHDDLYDRERTRLLVDGLDAHPDWVAAFHDLRLIEGDGEPRPGTYLKDHRFLERASVYLTKRENGWFECSRAFYVFQSLVMGALHTQSVLIAIKRLPAGTVSFDTQFTICDDTDLWIRLGLQGKMGYLDKTLSSYRQHPGGITRNPEKFLLDAFNVHRHNFARIGKDLTREQASKLRSRISNGARSLAYLYYSQLRLPEARAAYLMSLGWAPSMEAVGGYLKTFLPRKAIQLLGSRHGT